MPRPLRIACLQTRPMPDMKAALGEALPLAEAARENGAQILFLPEYCGGLQSDGASLTPPHADEDSHAFLSAFRQFAAEQGVWVMLGSIAVTADDGRIINRGYLIDDKGLVTGTYDKIHLFDVQISESEVYRESDTIEPGSSAVLHSTPFGQIGHTICYDLRFPHLYRELAHKGAEMLTCPAAFTKRTGEAHWHVLNRARAIENGCYMISPCATGAVPGGGESYGHSLVVDPWGAVVADGGTAPGIVCVDIDLDAVAEARNRIPSLRHDRAFNLPAEDRKGAA